MQDDPRNRSLLTPCRKAESITFAWIVRFSYRKSAGYVSLARMPPTFAAARKTNSGRCASKNASTAARFRRSTESRPATIRLRSPAPFSARTIAEPTSPRCPATKTRLPLSMRHASGDVLVPRIAQRAFLLRHLEIVIHHAADKLLEIQLRRPAQFRARLRRIPEQI